MRFIPTFYGPNGSKKTSFYLRFADSQSMPIRPLEFCPTVIRVIHIKNKLLFTFFFLKTRLSRLGTITAIFTVILLVKSLDFKKLLILALCSSTNCHACCRPSQKTSILHRKQQHRKYMMTRTHLYTTSNVIVDQICSILFIAYSKEHSAHRKYMMKITYLYITSNLLINTFTFYSIGLIIIHTPEDTCRL